MKDAKKVYIPTYKIVLLGPSLSGKTQFVNAFINNSYSESHIETKKATLYKRQFSLVDRNHPKPDSCNIELIDMYASYQV